jgi:hypothetical protein
MEVRVSALSQSSGQNKAHFEKLEERQLLSAVPLESKIKVAMSTDAQGNALNQSVIQVRFSENINLADASKFRMFGYGINPTSGSGVAQQKITINITGVTAGADGNKLVFTTDRRVRKNAQLIMFDGGITNASDGTTIGEQLAHLPKGLNKERYTLACRAFTPTQKVYFDPTLYSGAGALVATPTEPLSATVTSKLTAFLDKKVTLGQITADQKAAALTQFNDTTIKSIVPSANLRAALVSLVGTVAEDAIAQFTTGKNVTGKAFTVIDFSTEVSNSAVIAETTGNPVTKRIRTLLKTDLKGESFIALSAVLAHEAIHQDLVGGTPDLPDGINEEKFATTVGTMVWAQQLLVDKTPADDHTRLVTDLNAQLTAMLNSGLALFPRVGELNGPVLGGNVFPGSIAPNSGGAYKSFDDYIQRTYAARNFADVDTVANGYALTVSNNITQRGDTASFNFSDSRITFFDNSQQIITDKSAVALAAVLKLQVFK